MAAKPMLAQVTQQRSHMVFTVPEGWSSSQEEAPAPLQILSHYLSPGATLMLLRVRQSSYHRVLSADQFCTIQPESAQNDTLLRGGGGRPSISKQLIL